MKAGPDPRLGRAVIPGGLLCLEGLGVLITGYSGIGKSESALELVARGHRFVSDDVVEVERTPRGRLLGRSPDISRHCMEIRGLGIINIKEIFGARSVKSESAIDLVIILHQWEGGEIQDRLGLEFPADYDILGLKVPCLNIPVAPGRNIATLIEVACKVQRLRRKGYHASQEVARRLDHALRRQGPRNENSRDKG